VPPGQGPRLIRRVWTSTWDRVARSVTPRDLGVTVTVTRSGSDISPIMETTTGARGSYRRAPRCNPTWSTCTTWLGCHIPETRARLVQGFQSAALSSSDEADLVPQIKGDAVLTRIKAEMLRERNDPSLSMDRRSSPAGLLPVRLQRPPGTRRNGTGPDPTCSDLTGPDRPALDLTGPDRPART